MRVSAYLVFLKILHKIGFFRLFVSSHRFLEEKRGWDRKFLSTPLSSVRKRIWLHAASAGELEILWPVSEELLAKDVEFVLTVLSPSGSKRVDQLADRLRESGAPVVFSGFSPLEGGWGLAIEKIQPSLFITAKYEAWPELWISLAEREIPLVVVGARMRRSLAISRAILRLLGSKLPRITFCCVSAQEKSELDDPFGGSRIEVTGDPRWDQVFRRAKKGSQRAGALVGRAQALRRPWGVLGSVWAEDIELWAEGWKTLSDSERRQTLWVVPHHVDEKHLSEISAILKDKMGLCPRRSSELDPGVGSDPPNLSGFPLIVNEDSPCLLVDEMGFLAELYAHADWAYVGGGFGKGLHSTIEPAIYGIAIAGGPKGLSQFSEIEELQNSGQFRCVNSGEQLARWLKEERVTSLDRRSLWRQAAEKRQGSTTRVVREVMQEVMRNG